MTETVRPHRASVAGLALLGTLLAVLGLDLRSILIKSPPFPVERIGLESFRSGEAAKFVEDYLQNFSWVIPRVKRVFGRFLIAVAGVGNSHVVAGVEMLFDRARVDLRSQAIWDRHRAAMTGSVQELARALKAHGATLSIAIVPDTLRVYPEQLPSVPYSGSAKHRFYRELMEDLERVGARPVDLERCFIDWRSEHGDAQRLFFVADHHWTALGCQVGGEAIARSLMARSRLPQNGPKLDLSMDLLRVRPSYFSLLEVEDDDPSVARYREPRYHLTARGDDGKRYRETTDAGIALVGDSFAVGDVHGAISKFTGSRVASSALHARGPLAMMYRLLEAIGKGYRPREVIWVFEELGIYHQTSNWSLHVFGELIPKFDGPVFEERFPKKSIAFGPSVNVSGDWPSFTLRSQSYTQEIRLERPTSAATHVVLYIRTKMDFEGTWGWASIADMATKARGASATSKGRVQVVEDVEPLIWRRVLLPIPTGREKLVVSLLGLGTKVPFEVRDLGYLTPSKPSDGARGRWTPTHFRSAFPGLLDRPTLRWQSTWLELPRAEEGGSSRPIAPTVRSVHAAFSPALKESADIPLVLRVDGTRATETGPVVFAFWNDRGQFEPRYVAFFECEVSRGKVVEHELLVPVRVLDQTPIQLGVDVRLRPGLENAVVATVLFPSK